jgi:hypothetical protein
MHWQRQLLHLDGRFFSTEAFSAEPWPTVVVREPTREGYWVQRIRPSDLLD